MRKLLRLMGYVQPYWLQAFSSVILMAGVGLLDAFRLLLVGPIFERVLNPNAPDQRIPLFGLHSSISLQQIVPAHFHNEWTIVAFALVASTLLKGIFDYCGTYLVNYAGFGMITDSARRFLRRHPAALRLLFPTACHRHHRFHADQRY